MKSGDAAGPAEGDGTKDRGGGVGGNASNFCGRLVNGISGTTGSNRVTDGVTRKRDRDGKCGTFEGDGDGKGSTFEDSINGAGVKNDTLYFRNGAANGVTETRYRGIRDSVFEDASNDGAGAGNNTLDFSDRTANRVTKVRDGDGKGDVIEDRGDSEARATTALGVAVGDGEVADGSRLGAK